MKRHLYLLVLLLISINGQLFAQPCGNEILHQNWKAIDPQWEQHVLQTRIAINDYLSNPNQSKSSQSIQSFNPNAIIIPVVVHVLYKQGQVYGTGQNISYTQIQSQIAALNAAYDMDYPNYNGQGHGPSAVPAGIQFCLATYPMGDTGWTNANEPGVMRYPLPANDPLLNHQMTIAGATALLALTHPTPARLPFSNYMNVWTVEQLDSSNNVIGYAPEPLMSPWPLDGVVIRSDAFGDNTTGGSFPLPLLQQGKVVAHEVGHYLSLWHTFEQGCAGYNNSNCSLNGDFICDTPPCLQPSSTFNCGSAIPNTCADTLNAFGNNDTTDMPEDYMYYSFDVCWNTFTNGQALSMQAWINLNRSTLVSPSNLAATGVSNMIAGGCLNPILLADINVGATQICDSTPVQFSTPSGNSYAAVSWFWQFPGGSPATSTAQNPVVTYNTAGAYTVTLTAYDINGGNVINSIPISVSTCSPVASTQGNWYFGQYAGLNFSSGIPVADTSAWHFQTTNVLEGVVCENDTNGNLLFYYNNYGIWNRDHEAIALNIIPPNTQYPNSPPNFNSTSQLLSVPFPGHPGQYYLFTLPVVQNANGFHYSIVDMNQTCTSCPSLGPGQMLVTNQLLFSTASASNRLGEGITAVPHCNGHDYWIIVAGSQYTNTKFYVWLLTANGVSAPATYPVGINYIHGAGCLKASPDGHKIAAGEGYGTITTMSHVAMWDFNNTTGAISNGMVISNSGSYGVSFSPNSQLLYYSVLTSQSYGVRQYDIQNATDISLGNGLGTDIGAFQLSPEIPRKIYFTRNNITRLGVINNPDIAGTGCAYSTLGPILNPNNVGITGTIGLPNMIDAVKPPALTPSFTLNYTSCNTVSFTTDACWAQYSMAWNFGDPASGPNNTSTAANPTHVFSSNGSYTVTLIISMGQFSFPPITQTVNILITPPVITGPPTYCTNQLPASYSVPQANGYTYLWSTTGGGNIQGPNNFNSVQVNWTSSGSVICTLTNGACTVVSVQNVTVFLSPIVYAGPDTAYCSGGPGVQLPATVTGGTAPYTYSWSPATGLSSTTVLNPVATPGSLTTYILTVTDANGCTGFDAVIVNNGGQAPTVNFSAVPTVCDFINNFDLSPFVSPSAGTFTGPGITGNLFDASSLNAGVYQVIYTYSNGVCSNSDTQNITVTTNCCSGSQLPATFIGGVVSSNTIYNQTNYVVSSDLYIINGATASFTANVAKVKFLPGVRIIVYGNCTLDINSGHWYACTNAWTGIILRPTATLTIDNAWIEDAYTAISVLNAFSGAANFQVNNTIFNKNYRGIEVLDWSSTHPGSMVNSIITCRVMPQNPTVSALTPTVLAGLNTTAMVPPLNSLISTAESQYGIYLRNIGNINIGAAASPRNTFDNLDYGIWAVNSSLKSENNYFQYIVGRIMPFNPNGYNPPAPGAAILANDTFFVPNTTATYNSITVGGSNSAANSFFNCARAVDITNYTAINVSDNNINNATTSPPLQTQNIIGRLGIMIRNYFSTGMAIRNNSITNTNTGISIQRHNSTNNIITSANIQVENNKLTKNGTATMQIGIFIGDVQANSIANSTGIITINKNKVEDAYNCIKARNIKSPLRIENNARLYISPQVNSGAGISVEMCMDARVFNNTQIRSANSSNPNIKGIFVQQGANVIVTCNHVDTVGRGLIFQGVIPGAVVKYNTIDSILQGLVLFQGGDIGSQGSSTAPSDNRWVSTYALARPHTATFNSPNAAANILYVRSSPAMYFPSFNQGAPPISNSAASGPFYLCPVSHNITADINQMYSVANNTMNYANNPNRMKWLSEYALYIFLKQNNSFMANDPVLQSFYKTMQGSNIGSLEAIDDLISSEKYTSAQGRISSFSPVNDIEDYNKTFYTHYVAWLITLTDNIDFNEYLNDEQRADLQTIANLCPEQFGTVVYQARNLLDYMDGDLAEYNDDDCSESAGSGEAGKFGQPQVNINIRQTGERNIDVNVYPNPNNGNMTVSYRLPASGLNYYFTIYDVTGKEVGRYRLPDNQAGISISEKVISGIYIYKITNDRGIIRSGRITVID